MEGIMTNQDLIDELSKQPLDAPVMIAVIKYPEEFPVTGWLNSETVECKPLESGEVTLHEGLIVISVELDDYSRERHFAGG